ncbi:hypothetical protein [Fischerella sp. NIES-3754]|nr:hypothetical protein [Fischerella sp. NIES-3754]
MYMLLVVSCSLFGESTINYQPATPEILGLKRTIASFIRNPQLCLGS